MSSNKPHLVHSHHIQDDLIWQFNLKISHSEISTSNVTDSTSNHDISDNATASTRDTSTFQEQTPSPRDAFLFYLEKRAELPASNASAGGEDTPSHTGSHERKSRITFERDPLSILMDNEDFQSELEALSEMQELMDLIENTPSSEEGEKQHWSVSKSS